MWEILFPHSPSLNSHIKIYHSPSSIFVLTPPFFSSIIYPSPSTHVKHLFSAIHLLFFILFCVFPILIYLFLSLTSTFLFLFLHFFLPSTLDPLLCILKFYPQSFADHIFVLHDGTILCFTPPSLLKFVILLSNPERNHWGSVWFYEEVHFDLSELPTHQ